MCCHCAIGKIWPFSIVLQNCCHKILWLRLSFLSWRLIFLPLAVSVSSGLGRRLRRIRAAHAWVRRKSAVIALVSCVVEMCFAPQRRALFRHLNFQKWSENGVFYAFWLRNVLRATTACNFSSLIWPAGSAPAALESLLFDPLEPQIIGKTQCFATFLTFLASASSFFWLFLFYPSFF